MSEIRESIAALLGERPTSERRRVILHGLASGHYARRDRGYIAPLGTLAKHLHAAGDRDLARKVLESQEARDEARVAERIVKQRVRRGRVVER